MNPYPTIFCPVIRKTMGALVGLDPPWNLSGRAALWLRTLQTGPANNLGLIWHGRNRLGILPVKVRDRLEAAKLDVGMLQSSVRRLWLGVRDAESSCVLKLTAEPAPPLAPAQQFRLHDRFIYVESWRDIQQTTLCSLNERRTPEDLGDLYLLLRRGTWTSLEQGLSDALRRDPRFDPERLALSLARLGISEADPPPGVSPVEFGRFQQNLVIRILAWARSH